MTLWFIRIFFLIISTYVGFFVAAPDFHPQVGAGIGCTAGLVLIFIESRLRKVSVRGLSSMVFGLLLGVFMAKLIADILSLLPLGDFFQSVTRVSLTLVFSYLGAVMALRGKDEFHIIIPYVRFKREDMDERITLLDTSAVVDGRIMDLARTGFFKSRLVVPRFVLQELQRIADSNEDIKRQRGRRGLEILEKMQKDPVIDIRIHEDEIDIREGGGVDAQLIRLAKMMDARIYTLDFNLCRVAALQGIEILNINELVNVLKPVVYPGEEMKLHLLREGKEPHQAVAYTEDGTMVVVSEAGHLIGQDVAVNIVSVLQTQAGRMIFAKLIK